MATSTRFVAVCLCGRKWEIPADGVTRPVVCACYRRWDARAHGDTITITTYTGEEP
jgi:hypothetical protein